jgi:sulfite reductase alpha subunit-like flavoprotein
MLNTPMENKVFGFGVPIASAAVGEGDLPDGIMAFQKLVKYQKDLDNVADSVKKRGSEMDNMEIQQLKIFMKQLANEYGDMEYLARGISSEKDREAAKATGKGLREAARAVDKGLSDGKTDILTDNYPAMKKQIADFFALLSDVPDEL